MMSPKFIFTKHGEGGQLYISHYKIEKHMTLPVEEAEFNQDCKVCAVSVVGLEVELKVDYKETTIFYHFTRFTSSNASFGFKSFDTHPALSVDRLPSPSVKTTESMKSLPDTERNTANTECPRKEVNTFLADFLFLTFTQRR